MTNSKSAFCSMNYNERGEKHSVTQT